MATKLRTVDFRMISRVIGGITIFESFLMATSLVFSAIYDGDFRIDLSTLFKPEYGFTAILLSVLITFVAGFVPFIIPVSENRKNIGKTEGFLIVVCSWISLSAFASLPFMFSGVLPSFTDAFFECMSGLTTTGATVIIDVESISRGVLYWRGMTSWIGGLGIITIFVSLLPALGIGGYLLSTVETTGMIRDKIHPKLKETAKRLFAVYIFLTVACTVALCLCGMSFYDSLLHTFATIPTGGFSTYNTSAQFFSPAMQYVLIFFMLISSLSFNNLFYIFTINMKRMSLSEEGRCFLAIVAASTLYIFVSLLASPICDGTPVEKVFRDSLFQVTSLITTTGFASADYLLWPSHIWLILFLVCFIGGCSGSTAGGPKVIRYVMLVKNCFVELKRQIHPQAVIPVKYDGKSVQRSTIYSVHAFIVLYMLVFIIGTVLVSMFGYDFETSLGASISALGNIGPCIGEVGPSFTFAQFCPALKWILSALMLLGRLEVFTVLVIFNKSFWVK